MLDSYSLKMPRAVYSGTDALDRMGDIIGAVHRVAVMTDQGVASAGLLNRPLDQIRRLGMEPVVLDNLASEPACGQVQDTVNAFRASGAGFIVAIGGGSVMDAAKLTSVLAGAEYGVRELLDRPALARKTVGTLMIPTTAGTGAEATPNAIVAVPEKEMKVGIVHDSMIADAVILDPQMIRNLPRPLAAATGMDALCHAVECFTSKKKTPFSDLYALQSFRMILENIEQACDQPDAMEAKHNMLLASFYAGVAITSSGTTAIHALSYPLGGRYHIAHGISNAILLLPVMRFNEPVCRKLLAEAYDRMGLWGAVTEEEKSGWILERMAGIVRHLDIPESLAPWHVGKEDLDALVEAGMGVQRLLANNMRPVTPHDARKIYQEVL